MYCNVGKSHPLWHMKAIYKSKSTIYPWHCMHKWWCLTKCLVILTEQSMKSCISANLVSECGRQNLAQQQSKQISVSQYWLNGRDIIRWRFKPGFIFFKNINKKINHSSKIGQHFKARQIKWQFLLWKKMVKVNQYNHPLSCTQLKQDQWLQDITKEW